LPSRKPLAMMKYLLLALAVTAISAESLSDSDAPEFSIDEFLDADMSLPCTPKTCVPICRPVTKYLSFGAFKLPYTENVCAPDHKCLAAAAACIKTLQAAMADAHKKGLALETASKAKNAAHASKASKDKAAAARKAEAAAAATALGLAKAAFEAAEKEAANAKAAKESASKQYTAKAAAMDARLKSYEKAQQSHKNAVAAYDGAKSAAAAAAKAYAAAVKAHCDAEAQHAAAVKNIGHGHLAQKNCAAHTASYKLVKKNTVCGFDTTLVHSGQAISVSQCAKMAADNKGNKCPADPDGQYFMYNPSYRGKPFCGCTRKGHTCGSNIHGWGGIDLYKNP